MSQVKPGLVVTIAAVGFLWLDGILLIMAGFWVDRGLLVFWGGVILAGGSMIIPYYRRYSKSIRDIDTRRVAAVQELESMTSVLPESRRPGMGHPDAGED